MTPKARVKHSLAATLKRMCKFYCGGRYRAAGRELALFRILLVGSLALGFLWIFD